MKRPRSAARSRCNRGLALAVIDIARIRMRACVIGRLTACVPARREIRRAISRILRLSNLGPAANWSAAGWWVLHNKQKSYLLDGIKLKELSGAA